jgi:hypothetical protein
MYAAMTPPRCAKYATFTPPVGPVAANPISRLNAIRPTASVFARIGSTNRKYTSSLGHCIT